MVRCACSSLRHEYVLHEQHGENQQQQQAELKQDSGAPLPGALIVILRSSRPPHERRVTLFSWVLVPHYSAVVYEITLRLSIGIAVVARGRLGTV